MEVNISSLMPYALAALSGFVGWLWRELGSIRKAQSDHRTHVAETYVTKVDAERTQDRIYAALERIEKKLDENR